MTLERTRGSRGLHGFTLFEALVAIALMGLVLGMLATVTARWLPTWNYGFGRLQRADLVGLVIERIAADLVSAEFVSLDRKSQRATFDGTTSSVVFVRSALGPNAIEGLEIVKLAEEPDRDGFALVRWRAPFTLLGQQDGDLSSIAFSDKVTLLRSPYRVFFSFADATLDWRDLWRNVPSLPSVVRISIEDESKSKSYGPYVSVIASLHMNASAICTRSNSAWGCVDELARNGFVRVDTDTQEQKK